MRRKPDMIRTVVLLFVVGLAITGLTSLQASEDSQRAEPATISAYGHWSGTTRTEG